MSDARCSAYQILRFLGLVAALSPLGCADPPTLPDSPEYAVQPQQQWAGGTVEVTASGGTFAAGDVIVRNRDTLAVLDRATDRVILRLPTDANGPTTLVVQRNGDRLGGVMPEAYGFEGFRLYPEPISDMITELPVPSGVSVVGRSYVGGTDDTSGGFAWIYPSTGTHRRFPGTPGMRRLFRVGVDPVTADIYFEWLGEGSADCSPAGCDSVHVGRIVGGELVDRRWVGRPCNRWGCEPLAGDVWIVPDPAYTCRVVAGPDGETCGTITSDWGDDPQGIERLWSADVALVLDSPSPPVFWLSSGEIAYRLTGDLYVVSVATDEGRSVFYLSARTVEHADESRKIEILRVRGADGEVERAFELTLTCPEAATPPARCDEPDVGYDPVRDVLLLLRRDTRTLEVRAAETFDLLGEVTLGEGPDTWTHARVLVDAFTARVFLVFAVASEYDPNLERYGLIPGTPVIEIRLPPP